MGPTAYKIFDERGGSIGRLDTNDWSLPDPAKIVSSRHAEVHFSSGAFYLQDLSTNGTFINTRDQIVERDGGRWLADGDRILIGEYEILVQIIDDGVPALETGDPPRETHGDGLARTSEDPRRQPQRNIEDLTDPTGLTALRDRSFDGRSSASAAGVQPAGQVRAAPAEMVGVSVPTDWQITRFRNPSVAAAPVASPVAAAPTPAASLPVGAPDDEPTLAPEDAVDLLLALGIDPTGIELDPHEFAMLAGLRAGYNAMLACFNPEALEHQYEAALKRESVFKAQRPRYWDMYREGFQKMSVHSEGGFRRLFGEAFEQAYHRTLDELLPAEPEG